ncbi:formate dehydrogenase accessory sulfurtransferase FdhD [Acidihalobacter prosperus]
MNSPSFPQPCDETQGTASIRRILASHEGHFSSDIDTLAEEAPLAIHYGEKANSRLLTMRTPGADNLLAAGLLHDLGILKKADHLLRIRQPHANRIELYLRQGTIPEEPVSRRQTVMTSACGICGDSNLELDTLLASPAAIPTTPIPSSRILQLPDRLHKAQKLFSVSGGLHAAALFDLNARLIRIEEDIGRHNAVDKIIGWAFLENRLPLSQHILMVSSRTSYEIVKKCSHARIPILAAISAPSTLAVELAGASEMTLIGFLRPPRFNIYTAPERISG